MKAMHEKQQVAGMATEVLRRQARARVEQTGESFEGALKAVLDTKAGRQLGELRDGSHCDESAKRWQEDLAPERAKERRSQARQEELDRNRLVAWESFMRAERRELELR